MEFLIETDLLSDEVANDFRARLAEISHGPILLRVANSGVKISNLVGRTCRVQAP